MAFIHYNEYETLLQAIRLTKKDTTGTEVSIWTNNELEDLKTKLKTVIEESLKPKEQN